LLDVLDAKSLRPPTATTAITAAGGSSCRFFIQGVSGARARLWETQPACVVSPPPRLKVAATRIAPLRCATPPLPIRGERWRQRCAAAKGGGRVAPPLRHVESHGGAVSSSALFPGMTYGRLWRCLSSVEIVGFPKFKRDKHGDIVPGSVQATGKDGLIGYLTFVALNEPRAYLGFLGRRAGRA
jgi:hypothetical protein